MMEHTPDVALQATSRQNSQVSPNDGRIGKSVSPMFACS